MRRAFDRLAKWAARKTGSAPAFGIALVLVTVWLVSGPWLGFSDTWQLIINTSTTIMTWLMLFLLQHTQNVDTAYMKNALEEIKDALERPAD